MAIKNPKDRPSLKAKSVTDAAIEIWLGTTLFPTLVEYTYVVDHDGKQMDAMAHTIMVCDSCLEVALKENKPKGKKCNMTPDCTGTFRRHTSLEGQRRPTLKQAVARKDLTVRRLSDKVTYEEIHGD